MLSATLSGEINILEDHNAILHCGRLLLMSNLRREECRSEIHQNQQRARLEVSPAQLELMELRKRTC